LRPSAVNLTIPFVHVENPRTLVEAESHSNSRRSVRIVTDQISREPLCMDYSRLYIIFQIDLENDEWMKGIAC